MGQNPPAVGSLQSGLVRSKAWAAIATGVTETAQKSATLFGSFTPHSLVNAGGHAMEALTHRRSHGRGRIALKGSV